MLKSKNMQLVINAILPLAAFMLVISTGLSGDWIMAGMWFLVGVSQVSSWLVRKDNAELREQNDALWDILREVERRL